MNIRTCILQSTSIDKFEELFPDEEACIRFLLNTRFGPKWTCPLCNKGRLARLRTNPKRLLCSRCRGDVSLTSGTLFEQTRHPIRDWFYLMLIIANSTITTPVSFVERHFGMSRMAAFRMVTLVRAHLRSLLASRLMGGFGRTVQIDETWIPQIQHSPSRSGAGAIVFGIFDEGRIFTKLVTSRRREELFPIITGLVAPGSTIVTDQLRTYAALGDFGYHHISLNHSKGEWINQNGQSMNGIESYWTSLKYYIRGSHISPRFKYFPNYLAEHAFKFNARMQGHCPFLAMISSFPPIQKDNLPMTLDSSRYRKGREAGAVV